MGSSGSNEDSKQAGWAETCMIGSQAEPERAVDATLPPKPVSPLIGTLVSGRYRVIEELGEGGMGAVYLAQHVALEKHVALKVLHPSLSRDPVLQERFLREAKAAARIDHKNVVNITDFGATETGIVFIVMELLQGQDMAAVLKERRALPWPEARSILLQVCHALSAAHEHGVIHRDIKPENVFVLKREKGERLIKVVDFGIAKLIHDRNQPKLTAAGVVHGTPGFIAPEQIQGGVVDHRADIYAVGALAYNILTGRPPFPGKTVIQVLTLQMESNVVPPSQVDPELGVPDELDSIVVRALAKDPAQRHGSMEQLARELEEVLAEELAEVLAEELAEEPPPDPEDHPQLLIVGREESETTYKLGVRPKLTKMTIVAIVLFGLGVALAAGVGVGFLFLPKSEPQVTATSSASDAAAGPRDSAAAVDLSTPDQARPAARKQLLPGARRARPRRKKKTGRSARSKKPAARPTKAPAKAMPPKAPPATAVPPKPAPPEPPPTKPFPKKPPPKDDDEGFKTKGDLLDPYGE
jgi:serine/threonine-protein kinase